MRADGRVGQAIGPVLVPRLIAQRTKAQGVGRKPRDLVLRELERHLDALDTLLGDGDWLASSALTIADVAVAAQVSAIAGAVEGRAALDGHPVTVDWLARVDAATA
jgi:glutathione S-transferase